MKKILFISHDASRAGAPLVLLHFLQWLQKEGKKIKMDIVFLKGGDLMSDFNKVSQNCYDLAKIKKEKSFLNKMYSYVLNKLIVNTYSLSKKRSHVNKIYIYVLHKLNDNSDSLFKSIAKNEYDVIYANTIVSVPLGTKLKGFSKNDPKLIVHIHELNTAINKYLPNFNDFIPQINQFVSVSKLVMKNLNENWGINPQINQLVYPFSDRKIQKDINENKYFEVGASGVVQGRKGDDLFIQVANYIKIRYPEVKIKFTWVGYLNDLQRSLIESDLEKANLKETVFFVGEQKQPENYFKNFDVFLMTSREDPFPLVCIELGKSGIPIICFENATGTEEILDNGGGFIVSYIDIVSMADKLILYYNDEALRIRDGEINKMNFSKFTSDNIGKELYNIIESI
jgi:glycosyltransferase involved in cell wall biosynthesis